MGLFHYLFSFEGRINRAKQWAILPVGLAIGLVIGFAFSFTIGFVTLGAVVNGEKTVPQLLATLISLWAFVELYIFRGTVGDNRYGPDPLAGRG